MKRTKKIFVGFLATLSVLSSSLGLAACGETGGLIEKGATENLHYQKIADKEEYRVIGLGLATETDIVISATYEGLPVTEIGEYTFSGKSLISTNLLGFRSLTSIEIPNSITSIGDWAFGYCSSLRNIEMPNSVTSIGNSAFYGCESLTSIKIPDSVTSIGDMTFYGCSSLTSIKIPDSVTSIGNSAFYGCDGLKSVVISDSVTSIDNYAFYNCDGLMSVTISDSVTSIGVWAFSGCSNLTSITFNGTKAQWDEIEKEDFWNNGVPATEVVCSDGEVAL